MQILLFFSVATFARTPKQTGNAAGGATAASPALIYSTYVSRNPADAAHSVAVGRDGSIYLVGRAAFVAADKGEAFVAHLSADGSSLLYLVYLGGGGDTDARAIALDSKSNAYVTGETDAANFPVHNALQAACSVNGTRECSGDAFLVKLNADGAVIFSTYLGGSGEDGANAIAVDAAGNIYVGGATASTDFPVFRALQGNAGGSGDGFIAQIAGDGSRVLYASYVGGAVLTNVGNTIDGFGPIGNNGLALVNQATGTINANAAAPLLLNVGAATNPGLLEASNGGTLQLSGAAYNNAGGTITANGSGSTVQLLGGTTIQGGLLTTTLGGVLGTAANQTVTLDGSTPSGTVTNQGTYTGADNS